MANASLRHLSNTRQHCADSSGGCPPDHRVRTCVRFGGGRLAALGALIGLALLLWSTLPARAAPVVLFADIVYTSSSVVEVTVIFDRPVTIAGTLRAVNLGSELAVGTTSRTRWPQQAIALNHSGATITYSWNVGGFLEDVVTRRTVLYRRQATHHIQDGSGNQLADFTYNVPYGTRPPPAAAPAPVVVSPDPANLARSAVQWEPVGGMHPVPARMSEISSNKPTDATASLDLSAIAASVREGLRVQSRGFYVTTLVESAGERRHILRNLEYELARGSPLLRVSIWHIYRRASTGVNTVELLGEVFLPRKVNLLAEPVELCLPAPSADAERARIAVRGRTDSEWTILETALEDGMLCAETVRVSWFVIVLEPESEDA